MKGKWIKVALVASFLAASLIIVSAQEQKRTSSYAPVDLSEPFATVMARMKAAKAEVMRRQMALGINLARQEKSDLVAFLRAL